MLPALVLSLTLLVSMASPSQAMQAPAEADTCLQHLMLERSDAADPLPFGALVACPGIRPGAGVITELGGCTLNFVFRGTSFDEEGKPVDEGLFIGTAAHCILQGDGEEVWAKGSGPAAADATDQRFGEFAYARQLGATPTQKNIDFSLIRIDDAREPEVNPALCHFGGPTGMSNTWSEGDVVHHFGQGDGFGDTVPARSGVLWSGDQSDSSAINVAGAVVFGDSGGPLIQADGDALGVLFAGVAPAAFAVPIGTQVELAEEKLDMQLDLVTAPLAS